MFEHGSSREGDPLLHTHTVLMGVSELENGKTGALEASRGADGRGRRFSLPRRLGLPDQRGGFWYCKGEKIFLKY